MAKLFVTKSAFAAFVLLTVGLTPESYPFLSCRRSTRELTAVVLVGLYLVLVLEDSRGVRGAVVGALCLASAGLSIVGLALTDYRFVPTRFRPRPGSLTGD